eukprot:3646250-Rhodomonas_salina.1
MILRSATVYWQWTSLCVAKSGNGGGVSVSSAISRLDGFSSEPSEGLQAVGGVAAITRPLNRPQRRCPRAGTENTVLCPMQVRVPKNACTRRTARQLSREADQQLQCRAKHTSIQGVDAVDFDKRNTSLKGTDCANGTLNITAYTLAAAIGLFPIRVITNVLPLLFERVNFPVQFLNCLSCLAQCCRQMAPHRCRRRQRRVEPEQLLLDLHQSELVRTQSRQRGRIVLQSCRLWRLMAGLLRPSSCCSEATCASMNLDTRGTSPASKALPWPRVVRRRWWRPALRSVVCASQASQ